MCLRADSKCFVFTFLSPLSFSRRDRRLSHVFVCLFFDVHIRYFWAQIHFCFCPLLSFFLGVTEDPFIVLTSNVLAIESLRALYWAFEMALSLPHIWEIMLFIGKPIHRVDIECACNRILASALLGLWDGPVFTTHFFTTIQNRITNLSASTKVKNHRKFFIETPTFVVRSEFELVWWLFIQSTFSQRSNGKMKTWGGMHLKGKGHRRVFIETPKFVVQSEYQHRVVKTEAISAHAPIIRKLWRRFSPKQSIHANKKHEGHGQHWKLCPTQFFLSLWADHKGPN